LTFGWLCGELVRRVDGRSLGRFFRDEIAGPIDLEIWIGLPAREERRVAVLERDAAFADDRSDMRAGREVNEDAWSVWSNPPRFTGDELAANLPSWHAAEIQATNGIVAARSMARLYACLAQGGEIGGARLLSPDTLAQGTQRLARGHDPYLGEVAFATGFQVQTSQHEFGPPPDAYGHAGAGGSMHGAWPSLRVGFSYAPNLLASVEGVDPRAQALLSALYQVAST
jgi:CubicO group peptidase (beta-lactamase class C family)